LKSFVERNRIEDKDMTSSRGDSQVNLKSNLGVFKESFNRRVHILEEDLAEGRAVDLEVEQQQER